MVRVALINLHRELVCITDPLSLVTSTRTSVTVMRPQLFLRPPR